MRLTLPRVGSFAVMFFFLGHDTMPPPPPCTSCIVGGGRGDTVWQEGLPIYRNEDPTSIARIRFDNGFT